MSIGTLAGMYLGQSGLFGDPSTSMMIGAVVGNQIEPALRKVSDKVTETLGSLLHRFIGKNRVIIYKDVDNPIYTNLERYIVKKYFEQLRECELRPFNGAVELSLLSSKFSKPVSDNYQGHQIKLLLDSSVAVGDKTCNAVFVDSSTAGVDVLKCYINSIAQFKNTAKLLKIYRCCKGNNSTKHDRSRDSAESSKFYWKERELISVKNLDNTVVSAIVKTQLFDDVANFMTGAEQYAKQGLPWNRGYLLHGPPGTGKTSAIKAIANTYNLPMFTLSLNIFKNDSDFSELMADITLFTAHQPYILIMEDLDHADVIKYKGCHNTLSMSALLNEIDGVTESHGRILFITTNSLEAFSNTALIRPGRIDRIVELTYCTNDQYKRLVSNLLQIDLNLIADLAPAVSLTPTQVIQRIQELKSADPSADSIKVINRLNELGIQHITSSVGYESNDNVLPKKLVQQITNKQQSIRKLKNTIAKVKRGYNNISKLETKLIKQQTQLAKCSQRKKTILKPKRLTKN